MPDLLDMLKLHVSPRMRAAKMRRKGCTYRISDLRGSHAVIQVQRAGSMRRDEMAFFVNIGVIPEAWMDYLEQRTGQERAPDPSPDLAFLSARLPAPEPFATDPRVPALQVRWSLPRTEDVDGCSRVLADALENDVVPLLRRLLDPLQLSRLVHLPPAERGVFSKSLHVPNSEVLAAITLAPFGPSPELEAAIEALRRRGLDDMAAWAVARAGRS